MTTNIDNYKKEEQEEEDTSGSEESEYEEDESEYEEDDDEEEYRYGEEDELVDDLSTNMPKLSRVLNRIYPGYSKSWYD